ncbi:APH domain-containing protein [Fusarium falciforme]|uniref:APH domain-containing protein n=1 Tax=Fusarium falciforme TaxID=195108 RepID=UPI00230123FC|nr:APH domain-containing protein [Fusarium falciforme]WAO95777.1 APH domain-containing protein [Fusarium falciforme]
MGEVATLEWVRHFTDIPVPYVIAFDPSSDNEIGFEWLLMPSIAGTTADKAWGKMSLTAKEAFAKRVAEFQAQLLDASETKSHLRGIGTLTSPFEKPGQLVSCHWLRGDHFGYDVHRGPFHSIREWIDSSLRITMLEVGSRYLGTQDELFLGTIECQLQTAESLLDLIPTVFPATDQPEQTAIYKSNLGLENILVDEEGTITGILEWEYTSAMPCHHATELPLLLTAPIWPIFIDMDLAEARAGQRLFFEVIRENQEKVKDRVEYEQTQLRKIYTERMGELRPTWDAEVAGSALKNDFINAACLCADEEFLSPLGTWIRAVKNGENIKL